MAQTDGGEAPKERPCRVLLGRADWAKRNGCLVGGEALGSDYAIAKQRCDEILNPQFDAWRNRKEIALPSFIPGTFDWMVAIYKSSPLYTKSCPRRPASPTTPPLKTR